MFGDNCTGTNSMNHQLNNFLYQLCHQKEFSHSKCQKTRKEGLYIAAVSMGISGKPFYFVVFYSVVNMQIYYHFHYLINRVL